MVRRAELTELERVNELRYMVNELHVQARPDRFLPGFGEEIRDYARQMLESERGGVYVALRDGRIVGYAVAERIERKGNAFSLPQRFLHVVELGVDESCRRQGVATELVDYLRALARAEDLGHVELDVWAFNREALSFYEALGFTEVRRFLELKA